MQEAGTVKSRRVGARWCYLKSPQAAPPTAEGEVLLLYSYDEMSLSTRRKLAGYLYYQSPLLTYLVILRRVCNKGKDGKDKKDEISGFVSWRLVQAPSLLQHSSAIEPSAKPSFLMKKLVGVVGKELGA